MGSEVVADYFDHAKTLEAAQQELSESEQRELDEQTQAAEER
ncbi:MULTISPECIES: hypothetical protein [Actinomadura]|uniref:Uncharacterized protein n=1 Tax=Actinomadura yumaensis TaxID=111807 RepID=A0ABW2CPT5_9ACTN|nr:hypothetical protein [Actinomadura sp. J1-007]